MKWKKILILLVSFSILISSLAVISANDLNDTTNILSESNDNGSTVSFTDSDEINDSLESSDEIYSNNNTVDDLNSTTHEDNINLKYEELNDSEITNETFNNSLGVFAEYKVNILKNYYGSPIRIGVESYSASGAHLIDFTLKLKVDDTVYTRKVRNFQEIFFDGSAACSLGTHTYEVSDANLFLHGITAGTFEVIKAPSKIDVAISNSTYGNATEVTVLLKEYFLDSFRSTSGVVNITIEGVNYEVNVINGTGTKLIYGINAGTHNATVFWEGTAYFQPCNTTTAFHIDKADPNLSIYVPDVTYGKASEVIVKLYGVNNELLTGNVTVTINNQNYTIEVINGVGKRSDIYITEGEVAYVYWEGNNNYNNQSNQTSFNIGSTRAVLNIEVTDSYYGENNIIAVKLTDDDYNPLNGTVMVFINNKNYKILVTNGVGTGIISSLDAGFYNVGAIFYGNKYCANTTAITTFTVYKINPTLDVIANDSIYGVGSNITIKLNGLNGEGLNNLVTVSVSGKDYNVLVKNGMGTLETETLASDSYLVTATFGGNNNYLAQDKVTSFKVEKAVASISAGIDNSTYGENVNLAINLYDNVTLAPIESNVLVIIGGKSYTVYVPNEGAYINLTDIYPAGVNNFEVVFNGNENYTENIFDSEFYVNKSIYVFDVETNYSTYGDDVLMTIKIYSNTTLEAISSDVTFTINEKTYNIHVSEEGTTLNLTTLVNAEMNYYIINFTGDNNYNATIYSGNFSLNKATATLNILANDSVYGENTIIGIELYGNEPITDTVNLTIDNQNYTVDVKNGKGVINLGVLSKGSYLATAYWNGNINYINQTNTKTFTIKSMESYMNIIASNSVYGQNVVIAVKLTTSNPITDNVTVTIDNKKYIAQLNNGIGKIEVSGLDAGYYTANAYWLGNGNYSSAAASTTFNIEKANPYLEINIDNITADEGIAYIKLYGVNNEPLTGIVSVTINNAVYAIYVVDGEGRGNVTLELNASAIAKWGGNDNYNNQTNMTSYNIGTFNSNLNISVNNNTYGNNITINVTLYDDSSNPISGIVIINIANNNYFVNVTNGFGQTTVTNLPAGNYTIKGIFIGNTVYAKANKTLNFNIYKADSILNVEINNVTYGNITIINVKLTGADNEPISGEVNVEINNNNYTIFIENGVGILELKLDANDYNITVSYDGDNNYNNQTITNEFNVNPVANVLIKIDFQPIVLQHKGILTVYLYDPNSLNSIEGNISISINDNNYNLTINPGGNVLIIENVLHGGLNNYSITFNGTQNYNKTYKVGTFIIPKITPQLDIKVTDPVYGQGTNITVYLSSAIQNLNGEVIVTIDGKDYIINVENGVGTCITDILAAGYYNVTAYYKGNENYTEQEIITSFNIDKKLTLIDVTVNTTVYGEPIYIIVSLLDNDYNPLSGNVFISIDDKKYFVNVVNGKGNLTINEPLNAGAKEITVSYEGNENYTSQEINYSFKIDKKATTINITANDINYGEPINIDIVLSDNDINEHIILLVDNNKYNVTIYNGRGNLVINSSSADSKQIIATYIGNNNYNASSIITNFTINKINPKIDININNAVIGEDTIIDVNLTGINSELLTGVVIVTIDNQKYTVNVVNGVGQENIGSLNIGNYTATAIWVGNSNYTEINASYEFKVLDKITTILNITVNNTNYGEPINIDITLSGVDGTPIDGNVILLIDNNKYNVTIYNGKGNLVINSSSAGSKQIIVTYLGNDNYKASSIITNFTINKINPKMDININNTVVGEDTIIDVNLTGINSELLTGVVIVTIDNQKYTVKVVNGVGQENIGILSVGNYTATAIWVGNTNYTEINTSHEFEVGVGSLKLTIQNLTKYYSNNESLIISLTMNNNPIPDKSITIRINGVNYIRVTNSKGIVSLPLKLSPGNYNISAIYSDILTSNSTVTILNTILADDLQKLYLNDNKFNATFLDSYGNPLKNTLVKFNVNGIIYEKLTDNMGIAGLNINLDTGNYIITSYNPITGETKGNNINIISTIYSSDLEKIYHSSDKFEITLVDSNGNPLSNLTVKFNIHGIIYTKITDENGKASLNINLDAGEYIITTYNSFTDEMKSNIIKVVPSINSTDTNLYYHSGDKFSAVFFNSAGEPLVNQTISFNINGVIYDRITDDKGVATLTINLDAGEYEITSYNSITGESKANTLYVKPVLVAEDLVKTVNEDKSFEIVVLDTNGKPLSGETVAININGVIYNKITNEYGVARLAINLKPGKYIATSTWKDAISSNTIIVTN